MTTPRLRDFASLRREILAAIPAEAISAIESTRRRWRTRRLTASPPSFDPTLLPEGLRPWIIDEANRLGVPIQAIAVPALVSASAVIGSTAKVQVKRYDQGWTEPANLWGMTVGHSGDRKTPAINAGIKLATEIERNHRTEFDNDRFLRSAQQTSLDKQIKAVEAQLVAADPAARTKLEVELSDLLGKRAEIPQEPPRLITNNATMEKLAMLIEENPRGMLVVRDEIDGLFNTMSYRSGHEGDRAFYLEGYSANAEHTFDRVGRPSTYTYPFTLSLYGGIQPTVLAKHTKGLDGERGGDGLFARFQLLDVLDSRDVCFGADSFRDDGALERAAAIFRVMDAQALATVENQPRGNHRLVRFSDAAQTHFDRWRQRNENYGLHEDVTSNGAFAAYHAKSSGAAARLALVLHMIDCAAGDPSEEITLDQARRATALADYFIAQAKALYGGTASPTEHLARRIATRIRDGAIVDGAKVNDIRQLFSGKHVNTSQIRAALRHLEQQGTLTIEARPNPGARPSEYVRLNSTPIQPTRGSASPDN